MTERQTCLVIGSNSFSGACFVDHLLQHGYDVIGSSRSAEPDEALDDLEGHRVGRPLIEIDATIGLTNTPMK